jgi:hypothetical protein
MATVKLSVDVNDNYFDIASAAGSAISATCLEITYEGVRTKEEVVEALNKAIEFVTRAGGLNSSTPPV